MTKPKPRKPLNLVESTLLFNSILLLLTVATLTLSEICSGLSTKIYYFISYLVESYQSHIDLSRRKNIKKKIGQSIEYNMRNKFYWKIIRKIPWRS